VTGPASWIRCIATCTSAAPLTLLDAILSADEFGLIERERAELADVSVAVARAMDRSDWPLVKELSGGDGRCARRWRARAS
jgi:hypothetical protein